MTAVKVAAKDGHHVIRGWRGERAALSGRHIRIRTRVFSIAGKGAGHYSRVVMAVTLRYSARLRDSMIP